MISQSMFLPWIGFLQLMKASDLYVRLDTVKFSSGGFTNRVQIKTPSGKRWMTIPIEGSSSQVIKALKISDVRAVEQRILRQFEENYRKTPHLSDALEVIRQAFSIGGPALSDVSFQSSRLLFNYLSDSSSLRFEDAAFLDVDAVSGSRVLAICKLLGASEYISAFGGLRYLDHREFSRNGIEVVYPVYDLTPWPQMNGPFDPYVSALDLVAHCGSHEPSRLSCEVINWRDAIERYG